MFLITGPATNAAGFVTILKILGWKTALGYIFSVIVCALAAGLSLDILFPQLRSTVQSHVHQMEPSIFGHISAVVLLAMLGFAILSKIKHDKKHK